jgi:hypothetical protein
MTSVRLLTAAAAVAALGFAGCGDKKLDTDKLEGKVEDGVAAQTGTKIKSVECPSDVKAEKGNTFTCDITAVNGQTGKVTITQTDSDGNVRYELNTK